MIGLIKKDLFLIKSNLRMMFITIFVFFIMTIQGTFELSFVIPFICTILFISTFNYDEYNKWDAYAICLPNGKKNVVKSKYIASLIIIIISIIITTLISLAINCFNNSLSIENILTSTLGVICGVTLLNSIMYPLIFKFGVEKGRIGLFVGVFALTAIFGLLSNNIDLNSLQLSLKFLENWWFIILPVVITIMLYISYIISVKIYMNKEF